MCRLQKSEADNDLWLSGHFSTAAASKLESECIRGCQIDDTGCPAFSKANLVLQFRCAMDFILPKESIGNINSQN